MGAAASVALVPAAAFFVVDLWVSSKLSTAADVVNETLDSVSEAAEAVMGYVRTVASKVKEAAAFVVDGVVKPVYEAAAAAIAMADLRRLASSAFQKVKAAAAFVREKVIKLVRRLQGRKQAAAARRSVDRADAAGDGDGVLPRASASVARFVRQLVKALPPPSSSSAAVVSAATATAAAPGGALACVQSCVEDGKAVRAAWRASEMMALVEAVLAVLGDGIPEEARSCICLVVAAVGIGLETIAAAAADA